MATEALTDQATGEKSKGQQLLTVSLVDRHSPKPISELSGRSRDFIHEDLRLLQLLAVPLMGRTFNVDIAASMVIHAEEERIKRARAGMNLTVSNGLVSAQWRLVEYPNGIDLALLGQEIAHPPAPIIIPEGVRERVATLAFKENDKPIPGEVFTSHIDHKRSRMFKRGYFVDTEQIVTMLAAIGTAVKESKT